MKLTTEQRSTIYAACIAAKLPKDIAKKISVNADLTVNLLTSADDLISCLFSWGDSPEGGGYWKGLHDKYTCDTVETKPSLSLADIQTLISILKDATKEVDSEKILYTLAAANTWEQCVKGTKEGQESFDDFSYFKKRQSQAKAKQKKIGALLGKLKDMR